MPIHFYLDTQLLFKFCLLYLVEHTVPFAGFDPLFPCYCWHVLQILIRLDVTVVLVFEDFEHVFSVDL